MCHFLPVHHLGIAFFGPGRRSKHNTYTPQISRTGTSPTVTVLCLYPGHNFLWGGDKINISEKSRKKKKTRKRQLFENWIISLNIYQIYNTSMKWIIHCTSHLKFFTATRGSHPFVFSPNFQNWWLCRSTITTANGTHRFSEFRRFVHQVSCLPGPQFL